MKKTVFLLFACIAAGSAFGQVRFGVLAGPDMANVTTRTGGAKSSSTAIIGVAAGVAATLPMVPEFYLQPALLYEGKGQTQNVQGYNAKTRLHYLVLPVDFLYEPEMQGSTGSWMIGVGPYVGYGFSGRSTNGLSGTGDPFNGSLKRLDAGGHIQLGYVMNSGFSIRLESELGLMNLAKGGDQKNSVRNTSFALMVGYLLSR
jgi:hypothetical protein